MDSKIIPIFIALILIIGGGAFFGGMKYQQSKRNFQNFSEEQRQQLFQGNTGRNLQREVGGGVGSSFLSGEVISKDEQSVTLKTPNGGSKIIFFSDSTEIVKSVDGASSDLEAGKTISVSGTTNQDGSLTAKSIQVRY